MNQFTQAVKSLFIGLFAAALMTVLTIGVIVLGTALFVFDTLKHPFKRGREDAPGDQSGAIQPPARHISDRHPETGFPLMGGGEK